MFLVPSQYTLQAELEIMERLHVSGSFLIDVLSPKRLQSRVFELAGMPKRTLFDERGKCMVLSSIIEAQKDELSVYRGAAQNGSSGFTARMSNMIASLKRSGLSAADVARSAESMDTESPARAKLGDIARIYAAYEQRMAGELADAEDISREMCARFEASGVFKGQNVFVYGFDMITPTFAAELLSIAPLCRTLTLAIETDANAAPDGRLFRNHTGNPGMAKGGSGDTLAGMLVSLIGQGLAPEDAAYAAAWLHGAAGDSAANRYGEYGMTPTDLLACLPGVTRRYNTREW